VTVAELIAALQTLSKDLPVYRDDPQWGPLPISGKVEHCEPKPNFFSGEARPAGVVIK
jgi:hypothetical protein